MVREFVKTALERVIKRTSLSTSRLYC